jgi:hypothetical protein
MITLLKQTKRMIPFVIVFSVVAVMLFQACRRHEAMYKSQPVNINAAHAWLKQDGGMFKSEAVNFPLDNGTTVTGKLDWSQTLSYTWNGRSYLEIPYIFNGKRKIGNELSSFNMVIRRTKDGKSFEGALRTTSTDPNAKDVVSDEETSSTISSYYLPDGAPANMWVRSNKTGGVDISAATVRLTETQIAAMRSNKDATKPRTVMSFCWTTAVRIPVAGLCNNKSPQKKGVDGEITFTLEEEVCISTETLHITDCINIDDGLDPGGGKITPQNDDPFPPNPRGGGESNEENLPSKDPCDSAKALAAKIDSILRDPAMKKSLDSFVNKYKNNINEYGIALIKNKDGSYAFTNVFTSNSSNHIEWNFTGNPDIITLIHVHPPGSSAAPSPMDLFGLAEFNNPNFVGSIIISGNDRYMINITDRDKFNRFIANKDSYYDPTTESQWKKKSTVSKSYYDFLRNTEGVYQGSDRVLAAQLYVMENFTDKIAKQKIYGMGISLQQWDSGNNTFNAITTEAKTKPINAGSGTTLSGGGQVIHSPYESIEVKTKCK